MPDILTTDSEKGVKPIRIGIIGIGYFALAAHWPRLRDDKRVVVSAVCRRDEDLLNAAKKITGAENSYTDWRKMLESEDVDAVIVCTPNNLHKDPVIASLRRGIDVLVEKPMALTSQDAKEMTEAAETSSAKLMIGYTRRCNPDLRVAQKMVSEDRIGTVRQISMVSFADFSFFWNPESLPSGIKERAERSGLKPFLADLIKKGNWRSDVARAGGGFFVDQATHYIDTMLWFGQAVPSSVACFRGMNSTSSDGTMAVQAILSNRVLLNMTFTDGVKANPANPWGPSSLAVIGDNGVLFVNEGPVRPELNGVRTVVNGNEELITSGKEDIDTTGMFINLIASNGINPAPAADCFWTVALSEAAYLSAEQHCIIDIPQESSE